MPEQPIIVFDFIKREVRLAPAGTVCSTHATSSTSAIFTLKPKA